MRRVTLQMIADAVGLSRSTVSRALKNHPDISSATTKKVQNEAERLGYKQDVKISELMIYLRRSKGIKDRPCIAVIRPVSNPSLLKTKAINHPQWLAGVIDRAETLGFQLECFALDQKPGRGITLSKVLWNRGIRGVIVGPLGKPEKPIELIWEKFCLVAIGNSLRQPSLHRVMTNHYKAFTELTKQLIQKKYKRIGCALLHSTTVRTNYIYHGAIHAMKARYGNNLFAPAFTFDYDKPEALARYCDKQKIDVLVTDIGDHTLTILTEQGINVPQDLSLVALQVSSTNDHISGMNFQDYKVGQHSIDVLSHVLHYNELGIPKTVTNVLIDPYWFEGRTTRKMALQYTSSPATPSFHS